MQKVAVITGAGSGVGRAVALGLASAGWKLALVGRREDALKETEQALRKQSKSQLEVLLCPCDVSDPAAVEAMAEQVIKTFGTVLALINAAGTNTPQRSLEVLDFEKYRQIVDINLTGSYLCAQAFLPAMRLQGSGDIINIVSDAGRQASPKAGVAYVVSKFGQAGLTQAINAEERSRGIRACAIFPGDINTAILDLRPNPPPSQARAEMLQPEDIAQCVLLALTLPRRAIVEELVVRPR